MKRLNQLILLLTVLCLSANAGWIDLGGGEEGKAPDITLLSDDANGCRFLVTLYGFYLDTLNIPEGAFSIIGLPTATYRMEKGNPELPKLDVSVIIPDNGNVNCEIRNEDMVEIFDILPVIPSKGYLKRSDNPDTVPYTFNDIYDNSEWFPTSLQVLHKPFVICDYRGITVRLNIFRHNPVFQELEVARRFEVVLAYENPQFVYRDSISGSYPGIYENFFLNFSEARYGIHRMIKMTIITQDFFYDEAMRLREWKMKKGIIVQEVKSVSGPDTTYIKNYIREQWLQGVDYFLLVGHIALIPSLRQSDPYEPTSFLADPRYVLIYPDASDPYPDAFISRISGLSINAIRNQIDKILYYERLPSQTISFDWTKKALVMASQQGYYHPDSVYKNHMRDMLLNKYELADKLYNYAANPNNIKQVLENGTGFVNFIGHGDWDRWAFMEPYVNPVFSINDVIALENSSLLPFIISVACYVGNCEYPCFAEYWLQQSQLRGAVGFWGSSAWQYWHPPIWADSIAIQSFTHDWFIGDYFPNTFGQILYAGGIGMLQICPTDTGPFTFNTWHIFGDASMQVRFGQQGPLIVNHPAIAEPGGIFWVKVLTPYEGRHIYPPCPNAVVSLWKENDNYQDRKLTDPAGYAEFILPRNLAHGSMFVTVSKYNKIPYEGTAMIADTVEHPDAQARKVEECNIYINLSILPSISGRSFKIRIPSYATSVDIYNRAGKLVKKENADKREFIWQGTDGDGKPLPQGVYFVKVNGKEKTEVKNLLLIR